MTLDLSQRDCRFIVFALRECVTKMKSDLKRHGITEDEESELINDITYLECIEGGIIGHLQSLDPDR